MKNNKILFLILIIIIASVITSIILIKKLKKEPEIQKYEFIDTTLNDEEKQKLIRNVKLEYEKNIVVLISDYKEADAKNQLQEDFTDLKTRLFDLSVPEEYKDLHLQLAIEFDRLDAALKENNQSEISAAKENINSIIEQNTLLNNK